MPTIILLRHGQSEYNKQSRFCGWIDAPLTDFGVEQATNTSKVITSDSITSELPIYKLFTSRLQRAVKTSDVILENLNRLDMDVVKSWRLNERHYGSLQGLKKNDVLNQYGEEKFMYWRRNIHGCPPPKEDNEDDPDMIKISKFDDELNKHPELVPNCESLEMVILRLKLFLEQKIKPILKQDKNIMIVTHGSIVRALLTIFYKLSDEHVENLNIPNGMPIVINIAKDSGDVVGDSWIYLEPEKAKIEAERVKKEGFNK